MGWADREGLLSAGGVVAHAFDPNDVAPNNVEATASMASADKPRFNRRKFWRRKASWMRGAGGYLDYWQYYNSSALFDGETLPACGLFYWLERQGDNTRYRSKGCGDRVYCPACCNYHRDTMANDAVASMLKARDGLEITQGVPTPSYGLKLVLTVPKETSAWIEAHADRYGQLNLLYKAGAAFSKRVWGDGVAGVMGMDFAGATNPAEAHYHVNVYLFPGKRLKGRWSALHTWVERADVAGVRRLWANTLRYFLGADTPGLVGLEEATLWYTAVKSEPQLRHWFRYLFRSPLFDLWKGWAGQDSEVPGNILYQSKGYDGELASSRSYTALEIHSAMGRMADAPRKFKRIRWFGALSDGQRAKAFDELGLLKCSKDELDENEGWERLEGIYKLVKYTKGGIKLQGPKVGGDWGETFEVLDVDINFGPADVKVGKRERWRRPGEGG